MSDNIDLDILAARYRKHLRRTPREAIGKQFEQLRLDFMDRWDETDAAKLSAATAGMRTAVAQEFDFSTESSRAEERACAARLAELERAIGLWVALNLRPRRPMSATTKRRLRLDRFCRRIEKQRPRFNHGPLELWGGER